MENYEKIACEMLGTDKLPPVLRARLLAHDFLCKKAGGGLYSRQVIALLIMIYNDVQKT